MSEVLLDQRDLGRGPATIITGGPEVAQNIAEAVAIPFGSLPWDRHGRLAPVLDATQRSRKPIRDDCRD